ncbi:ATPase RavA stimulator ViaA [Vibrio salinus]|uniref:ATPase RavA stimulator ViaA n=1 Tax=Vibrio salinus TaxID=2899784 RepID=UPI001E373F6E|nr:ATPase RavA stimulator ViaA [Vibrio salinus]MCE0496039.1 ATPase RavA stimulator ViaA [Vibrio salinus]
MLGLDIADMTTSFIDSGLTDLTIEELIDSAQYFLIGQDPRIQTPLKKHVARWKEYVRFRLTKVSEADRFKKEMALYQKVVYWAESDFFVNIESIVDHLEGLSGFYNEARRLLDDENNIHNPMFPHYFCDQWYQSLESDIRQAQERELEEHKRVLLSDLYQRMETLHDLEECDEDAPTTPDAARRMWNMASTKLSKTDISVIKTHAQFLKKHHSLRELAEQLGRKASESNENNAQSNEYVDDIQIIEEKASEATDDIVGVHQKDDINRLLPNELLFLSHPELEVVFYKHLIDQELLNYELHGKKRKLKHITTRKKTSDNDEVKEGPFIVCIDASGSMQGFPEQAAKALAYALMQIALAGNRDCYVMIFSTQVIKYELTKQDGLREVSDFLSSTFHGGTDLEPVLRASVELLDSEKYKNADVVVLSDFMAPKQNSEIASQIENLKAEKNRFHAVSLSSYGNPQLLDLFDFYWSYHPSLLGRLAKHR